MPWFFRKNKLQFFFFLRRTQKFHGIWNLFWKPFCEQYLFWENKGEGIFGKEVDRKTLWVSKEREFEFFFKESHDFYDKISRKVVLFWKSYLFIWVRNELKRGFLFLKSFMGFYLWKGEGLKRKSNCFFFF